MSQDIETVEQRLNSFLGQLQTESAILERIVYKNKNQHRRCSYFQFLLKVRRDLKLLKSSQLEEILSSSFQVIHGKKPKQKVNLLESLKRRKCDGGRPNFMERLVGAARLLSQMIEPIIKAATEISTLLARSFFLGFSLTVLALLARFRVLIQQILLDVVSVYNVVSPLSRKEQFVKLTQNGLEFLREYYPRNEEAVITLECVWETDKFVLFERIGENEIKNEDKDHAGDVHLGASTIKYQSIEAFLGVDEIGNSGGNDIGDKGPVHNQEENDEIGNAGGNDIDDKGPDHIQEENVDASSSRPLLQSNNETEVEDGKSIGNDSCVPESPGRVLVQGKGLLSVPSLPCTSNPLKLKSPSKNKVAFLSVKKPVPSTTNAAATGIHVKGSEKSGSNDEKEDSFFNLLTGGKLKDSLF